MVLLINSLNAWYNIDSSIPRFSILYALVFTLIEMAGLLLMKEQKSLMAAASPRSPGGYSDGCSVISAGGFNGHIHQLLNVLHRFCFIDLFVIALFQQVGIEFHC